MDPTSGGLMLLSLLREFLRERKTTEDREADEVIRDYLEWLRRKNHQELLALLEQNRGAIFDIAQGMALVESRLEGLPERITEILGHAPAADFEVSFRGTGSVSSSRVRREYQIANLTQQGLRIQSITARYWLEDNADNQGCKHLPRPEELLGGSAAVREIELDWSDLCPLLAASDTEHGQPNMRNLDLVCRIEVTCMAGEGAEVVRRSSCCPRSLHRVAGIPCRTGWPPVAT